MTGKYNRYVMKKIRRLDIQHYLVLIHGKYYVIDYANPRSWKTYFLGLFPETKDEWKIYDAKDLNERLHLNISFKKKKDFSYKWIYPVFNLYVLDWVFMPKCLNIVAITRDVRIREHWLLVLNLLFVGGLLIFLIAFFQKPKLDLSGEKALTLKKFSNEEKKLNWLLNFFKEIKEMLPTKSKSTEKSKFKKIKHGIVWTFALLLSIVCCFLVSVIMYPSYSHLVVFLFGTIYSVFFERFTTLLIESKKNKFQIIDCEEK